ncbi:disease resistance protein Roq1-like [Quercus suber]|uniref:disease resistance protein Roq1-like n=1 Tax=Quercus suber TaxID=58331 RepID=UPI0032DE389D
MFRDKIGSIVEVYINNMVVKSRKEEGHVVDLIEMFKILRPHKLCLNTNKCTFGVGARKFLRNQSDLIEEIVKHIIIQVKRVPIISIPERLVGIDAHLSKIESHLDIKNPNEVRMLGIYGPQGVGKSTLAKVFYYKHFSEFECSSFVECIRERIKGKHEIVEVQKALLSEILGDLSSIALYNQEEGAKMIEDVLSSKRVLLVLDDVANKQQLEKLAGGFHWFGPGSRIIITTQKAKLLHNYKVHFTYKMKGMNPAEAVQLFSWFRVSEKMSTSSMYTMM